MADVIGVIKGSDGKKPEDKSKKEKSEKSEKPKKSEKAEKKDVKPSTTIPLPPPRFPEVVNLAAKYATFADNDCKLPPDLMAAVLKYMILNLKEENRLRRRIDAARERKRRNQKIKSDFIKSLKPFEVGSATSRLADSQETIQDEPFGGPDLYIMFSDFYDPFYFLELLKMNTPFVAILKISRPGSATTKDPPNEKASGKGNDFGKKKTQVAGFWDKLVESNTDVKTQSQFADIALIRYVTPKPKQYPPKSSLQNETFDSMSLMMYSMYDIYRQHQYYLQNLSVQRMVLSLEPLDLSQCKLYNKLCDALVTGEAITPCLVLYAMIEQVVAGVPDTESIFDEYEPKPYNFFPMMPPSEAKLDDGKDFQDGRSPILVTPCLECRNKKPLVCRAHRSWEKQRSDSSTQEKGEWSAEKDPKCSSEREVASEMSSQTRRTGPEVERCMSESLVSRVLTEGRTEAETRPDGGWVNPRLYLHGDTVELQTYHCDPRLINPKAVMKRFMENSDMSLIWEAYPKLSREKKALFDFHFIRFWKISKKPRDVIRLYVHFLSVAKLVGAMKSYLYKGVEKSTSEMAYGFGRDRSRLISKVKFDENGLENETEDTKMFCNFFRLPACNVDIHTMVPPSDRREMRKFLLGSIASVDPLVTMKSHTNLMNLMPYLVYHRDSGFEVPFFSNESFGMPSTNYFPVQGEEKKVHKHLMPFLDCFELSNLVEHYFFLNKESASLIIQNLKFYENLEPERMLQRLLEAQEDFNTVEWSYLPLTDALLILMFNDHDHRGIFVNEGCGMLLTPVGLRDFCNYTYPNLAGWFEEEKRKYAEFIREEQEKANDLEVQIDEEYLLNLKRHYCGLSEEERKEYISKEPTLVEVDVKEEDLKDLPPKPQYDKTAEETFIATNIKDIPVETHRKVQEFYSRDETEVDVIIDKWEHEPKGLLTLHVKKLGKKLTYYQRLGDEKTNKTFSFTTSSGIIFLFYKSECSTLNYDVTISWPTGLMIRSASSGGNLYVNQSYLSVYRQGWRIQEEKSRCFLRNGEVVVFLENGAVEVLYASGTKCILYDFVKTETSADENFNPSRLLTWRYEVTTSSGQVYQKSNNHSRRNKKKIIRTQKVYIGVDEDTKETFYKREDGVQCMLWPDGKLVTNFPDGTKITSTPDFDKTEVFIEWTEEEKAYLSQIETEYRMQMAEEERKDARRGEGASDDGFVSVSCSYLMEHPKYSSVFFDSAYPRLLVRMPEELSIEMTFEGNYTVYHETAVLNVMGTTIEFYHNCYYCRRKSAITLYTEPEDYICQFVDLCSKTLYVYKDGDIYLRDIFAEEGNLHQECADAKLVSIDMRCFAFERDLSGVEFLQADAVATYVHHLSPETHFEIESDIEKDSIPCHTFTSPHYEIGFEKWVMEYRNKDDSLPEKLKKNDLREQGTSGRRRDLFKYPYPKDEQSAYSCNASRTNLVKPKMPKVIETRIINCMSPNPLNLINEMKKYVSEYQKVASQIFERYKESEAGDKACLQEEDVQSKLRKIAFAFSQSFQDYPHLCTLVPSVEKEIHYFGHSIDMMETCRSDMRHEDSSWVPECKQIPHRLPRSSNFETIYEDE